MEPTLIKPTIHLNGSSPEDLYEGFLNAYHALTNAITVLEKAHPNGRDYYPQGNDAITKAVKQNCDRAAALAAVRNDMLALAEHCQDAIEAKATFARYNEVRRTLLEQNELGVTTPETTALKAELARLEAKVL